VLNELAVAKITLLDSAKKAAYDRDLKARLAEQRQAAASAAPK